MWMYTGVCGGICAKQKHEEFKCFVRRVKQKHDLFLVRKVLSKVSESQMARKLQVVCNS